MKYLIARRIVQLGILALFSFKATDFILQGNLSSSRLFNTIPLSDPFAVLQIILASWSIDLVALIGALIIFFTATVCPFTEICLFWNLRRPGK